MADYNISAKGYDFSGYADVSALCTMAVVSARTGRLCLEADGYQFHGNHNFRGAVNAVPRAMIQMALNTVKTGTPTFQAAGHDYNGRVPYQALVEILVRAINENVPNLRQSFSGPSP